MTEKNAAGINSLSAFDEETGDLNVVVETPKGSRNKYKYDEKTGFFSLSGILPLGGDGDPLDVLLLMDEPAFAGCRVPARLVGVIEAEQTEDGKTEQNDRLITVACKSLTLGDIKSIKDLNETTLEQIKHFFISYNEAKSKKFEPRGEFGIIKARKLIDEGIRLYRNK